MILDLTTCEIEDIIELLENKITYLDLIEGDKKYVAYWENILEKIKDQTNDHGGNKNELLKL